MPEYVAAEYGIPHCQDFKVNPDGFSLSYRKYSYIDLAAPTSAALLFVSVALIAPIVSIFVGARMGWAIVMVVGAGCAYVIWRFITREATKITVTKDAVILNDKHLRRADFGHWSVLSTQSITIKGTTSNVVKIGYSYGNQSFPLDGGWSEQEANEFVSALNLYMRSTTADRASSPEQLRVPQQPAF